MSGCAYFNTFYNAKKLFSEAQEIPLDNKGRPKATAVQKYNKAIKKCGVILTDYQKSKWADDALFLLARSLFYKGNSYIQAIEQFEDLILLYPDSEFIPEAKLYIARAKFRFNQKLEANALLQDFINDPSLKEHHPKALMILAHNHLEEDELVEANYTLKNLINKYPDSDEYEEAFFLQGITLHEDNKFQESNNVFTSLLKSRVSKKIKLDSRYFIVLNFLELEAYNDAHSAVKSLLKDEYRLDKIPELEIAEARAKVGIGETEEAISIFENIIENNSKSKTAADANFYLAETRFKVVGDYEGAIEAYNAVKTSFRESEFVEIALSRSAVVSKIIQYNNPETNIPTQTLIEQQFKLAEFYNEVLNRPDSALAIYDKIISNEYLLPVLIDSLETLKTQRSIILDSLQALPVVEVQPDSSISDSLIINEPAEQEFAYLDSIMVDTLNVNLQSYLMKSKDDLILYNNEYIPFARFIKIWLLSNTYNDTIRANETFEHMARISPSNKYTIAAEKLLNGDEVVIIDPVQQRYDEQYQEALDLMKTDVDQALIKFQSIAEDSLHLHYTKANYTLGHYYFFTLNDTTNAKLYFDTITKTDDQLYIDEISKYYRNNSFSYYEELNKIREMKETKEETSIEPESSTVDSLEEESSKVDTLALEQTDVSLRLPVHEKHITLLSKPEIIIPNRFKEFPEQIEVHVNFLPPGKPDRIEIDKSIDPSSPLFNHIINIINRWDYAVPDGYKQFDEPLRLDVFLVHEKLK